MSSLLATHYVYSFTDSSIIITPKSLYTTQPIVVTAATFIPVLKMFFIYDSYIVYS